MAQQTAVEWLEHKLLTEGLDDEFIKQAKQMEKEQIMNAHGLKVKCGFNSDGNYFETSITGEQYYNEIYENNK